MSRLNKQLYLGSLVAQGFSYRAAKEFDGIRRDVDEHRAKSIMRLLPFRPTFDKMFRDILTTRRVLWEERDSFPKFYALVAKRDDQRVICPLENMGSRDKLCPDDLVALLRRSGSLCIRPCYNALRGQCRTVRLRDEEILLDGEAISMNRLRSFFAEMPDDTIVMRIGSPDGNAVSRYGCACPVLHVVFVRKQGRPMLADRYVLDHAAPGNKWRLYSSRRSPVTPDDEDPMVAAATNIARRISRKYPEAPYLNVGLLLSRRRPEIWQVDVGKDLIWLSGDSEAVAAFLEERRRSRSGDQSVSRLNRYLFSAWAKRQGFQDYMYRNWLRGLQEDNRLTSTTPEEKRWAHQRGFYSYRIRQYGLTEENYHEILSDYDYKRLRPINGYYQKWLWDKVFMYHIMAPYKALLPRHYFRVVDTERGNEIYSFDPAPPGAASFDDVWELLRKEKLLVAKPSIGSHGKGFARLEWLEDSQAVSVNGRAYNRDEFAAFIAALDKPYFISEFIQMHDDLRQIYGEVVDTVRLMVIDLGQRPKVENAFFRIGSSRTGNTDNLDTGGIVARVDLETGRFDRAEMLVDHTYRPCPTHPDTGAVLEGVLPHWEEIKASVSDIAAYLYPLEYLGFDIVITQDGFRILEINTHQDLHRYPEYPQEVKEYFLRKRELKGRSNYV